MGVLEEIRDAIKANTAAIERLAAMSGGPAGGAPASATTIGAAGQTQQPAATIDPLGGLGGATTAAPASVSEDQLMSLIVPHVGNLDMKAAFGDAMRAMGIEQLNTARPDQYPALYQAFSVVIQRFTGGAAAQPAPAAAASII